MILSPALKELLALHEFFRRLGFLSAHLYVDIYDDGPLRPGQRHVQFVLRRGGDKAKAEFTVDIHEDCSQVTPETWAQAADWWNTASGDELTTFFDACSVAQEGPAMSLVWALTMKGLITRPGGVAQ